LLSLLAVQFIDFLAFGCSGHAGGVIQYLNDVVILHARLAISLLHHFVTAVALALLPLAVEVSA
jgi:hypothetical protein